MIINFNISHWCDVRSMIKTCLYDDIAKYVSTNCSTINVQDGQETTITFTYLDVSSEVIGNKLKLEMSSKKCN
jgi:hypothetical protein